MCNVLICYWKKFYLRTKQWCPQCAFGLLLSADLAVIKIKRHQKSEFCTRGADKSLARPGRKKKKLLRPNSGFIQHTSHEAQYTS